MDTLQEVTSLCILVFVIIVLGIMLLTSRRENRRLDRESLRLEKTIQELRSGSGLRVRRPDGSLTWIEPYDEIEDAQAKLDAREKQLDEKSRKLEARAQQIDTRAIALNDLELVTSMITDPAKREKLQERLESVTIACNALHGHLGGMK